MRIEEARIGMEVEVRFKGKITMVRDRLLQVESTDGGWMIVSAVDCEPLEEPPHV